MPALNRGKVELIALAIASGHSVAEAATAHGVNERTAFRWASEDSFKARVHELRRRMVGRSVGRLADAASLAASTLIELCGPTNPPMVRLGAAKAIISSLIEVQNHADFGDRLATLEARINEPISTNQGR